MAQAPPGDEDILRITREARSQTDPVDEALLGIASSLDPQHTMQAIVDTAAALTGAEYSSIWLRMPDHYEVVAAHGIPIDHLRQIRQPDPGSMIEQMMRGGVPLEVDNYPGTTENSPEGRAVIAGTGVRPCSGCRSSPRDRCVEPCTSASGRRNASTRHGFRDAAPGGVRPGCASKRHTFLRCGGRAHSPPGVY